MLTRSSCPVIVSVIYYQEHLEKMTKFASPITIDVIFINPAYLHVSMRAQGFFDVTPATPL